MLLVRSHTIIASIVILYRTHCTETFQQHRYSNESDRFSCSDAMCAIAA